MLSQLQRSLLDSITEIHRFETSPKPPSDFKAAVVETRFALVKVRAEIAALAIKRPQVGDAYSSIHAMLKKGIQACDSVAMLSETAKVEPKVLATLLVMQGDLAVIETFLLTLDQA